MSNRTLSPAPEQETSPWIARGPATWLTFLNAVILLTTLGLLWSPDRSTLTGVLILLWGGGACWLSHRAGREQYLDERWAVAAYLVASGVLYLILNGLYRLLGA